MALAGALRGAVSFEGGGAAWRERRRRRGPGRIPGHPHLLGAEGGPLELPEKAREAAGRRHPRRPRREHPLRRPCPRRDARPMERARLDPAREPGGVFVQSGNFVEEHGGKAGQISDRPRAGRGREEERHDRRAHPRERPRPPARRRGAGPPQARRPARQAGRGDPARAGAGRSAVGDVDGGVKGPGLRPRRTLRR